MNTFIDELKHILSLTREKKLYKEGYINENCYFLNDDYILCEYRDHGDSRYPYIEDGLNIWAHSSGYISINESNFFLIPPALEGKEPFFNVISGIKKNNKYETSSILGVLEENENNHVKVIYSKSKAIYIKEKDGIISAFRIGINKDKKILFSIISINKDNKEKEILLSTYINPLMMHTASENDETKWFKRTSLLEDGCYFLGIEDLSREIHLSNYALLRRSYYGKEMEKSFTTSHLDYAGGKNLSIKNSSSLRNGFFNLNKKTTQFNETAIYGDLYKTTLNENEYIQIDYELSLHLEDSSIINEYVPHKINNDEDFVKIENNIKDNYKQDNLRIELKGIEKKYGVSDYIFNSFIKSVINQVDYGSKTKNSSLMQLGVRDLFQMIESSLLWDNKIAREKIIKAFSFEFSNGRFLRQFSTPENLNKSFLVDSREFIDQGQWVISTLYTYLSFTNDFSILDENANYIELENANRAHFTNKIDTIYEHLLKIKDYLIGNIDEETGCLKTLYGDWNDAVDGLGRNYNSNLSSSFSNGVSSMATFHLYKNLTELKEIILKYKMDISLILELDKIQSKLKKSIDNNLIVKNEQNERRIIHGWGENKSFFVGSFLDVDNKSRHSLTSNSFYVISNLYSSNKSIKEDILKAYECLDSKYGLKTFDEFFDKDSYKVGRIINLPKGTAENAATYIHATIFAIKSLLMMEEPIKAYEQLFKVLPITHDYLTSTPFVMPNSYIYNEDLGVDGESMSDWYTGSSNTLIKTIVFDLFGIRPKLNDELYIFPQKKMFFKEAKLDINVKNKKIHLFYRRDNKLRGKIKINGQIIKNNKIVLSNYPEEINILI
ncbi:MAG: GH36-type glycosyl hydrolase domain-containing protein [Bacilli bacterium]